MFLKTYVQATASLANIRRITCVACQLVDSPFIVGRGVVVSGWFNQVGYGAVAFICYPDIKLVYLYSTIKIIHSPINLS